MPLVTIIIPTYNYRTYILEAINSVFRQTYPASLIQIIIIDDGSTDNTKEVLQSLIDSKKILYFYQSNKGKANATSLGIAKSGGKYIFNLDADDYFFPQKIEKTVAVFEAYENVVHVATPARFITDKKETFSEESFPVDIVGKPLNGRWLLDYFYTNRILFGGGSTYSARASALKKIEIPNPVDMYIDEFLIMAILQKGDSYFLNEPLSVWREHTANYSSKYDVKEKRIAKGERLLQSSAAMLDYVESNNFSKKITVIYKIINATRILSYKEMTNSKSFGDIVRFGRYIFFSVRPDFRIIKKYSVMRRLIPTSVLKLAGRIVR